jgi:hypothetical protein
MINLLNIVPEGSITKGWGVDISPVKGKEEIESLRNYAISLTGTEGVRIAIDRSKADAIIGYITQNDIDIPVVDRNVPISIYSIYLGEDKYLPIVTTAKPDQEDTTLLMLNFETDIGSVIHSVEVENFNTISYLIKNKDFKTRLALSGISINNRMESSIMIRYGYNNGRTLLSNKIIIPPTIIPANYAKNRFLSSELDQVVIDKISLGNITLDKMDLSTICVNNREK